MASHQIAAPKVSTQDGTVFANSRDVAEFFGKQHKHVLEAIRNLDCSPDFSRSHFRPFKINDLSGDSTAYVEMTRDGFMFLAMGFTGAKAARWKESYLEAFNAMEAQLRKQAAQVPDLSDPRQLLKLLNDYAAKAIELESKVDELMPSVEALDRIAGTEGSMTVTVAAKNLQVQPNSLFKYLRTSGWVYRRAGTDEDVAYQSKLQADLLEHKVSR